jgi:hypothetical protein
MLKDISELEIGCVYQYKDNYYDILGLYYKKDNDYYGNNIPNHWFKTISSVDNRWTQKEFSQETASALKYLTKLS